MALQTIPSQVKLASATGPGSMSAALFTKLTNVDNLNRGTVPAFTAGAATITPGTDKASVYTVAENRTLAQNSTLTVAATSALQGFYIVVLRSLNLGWTLTIANGGPLAGNLAVFPATMTVPRAAVLYFDGTNFSFEGWYWVEANS